MKEAADLITAIGTVLWPLIVLVMLRTLWPAIAAIAQTARTRGFTVEIAGQKLTMQEATELQTNDVRDLREQVAGLVEDVAELHRVQPNLAQARAVGSPRRILWVDDNPKNNASLLSQLRKAGVAIHLELSTLGGLASFSSSSFDVVLTDMGRVEGADFNPTAGLDLIRAVRWQDTNVPIFVFCSKQAREKYGKEALRLGATYVGSSPTRLIALLGLASER